MYLRLSSTEGIDIGLPQTNKLLLLLTHLVGCVFGDLGNHFGIERIVVFECRSILAQLVFAVFFGVA